MQTLILLASGAIGFGLGVLATLIVVVILAGVALFGWWRFCQALERTGLDIKIPLPDEPAKED